MDLDGIIAFFEASGASPKDLAGLARYGIKTDGMDAPFSASSAPEWSLV